MTRRPVVVADCVRDAERVRNALVQSALAAYEDAALQGLCCEGAWEAAVASNKRIQPTERVVGVCDRS